MFIAVQVCNLVFFLVCLQVAGRIENPDLKQGAKNVAASHFSAWSLCAIAVLEEALMKGGPVNVSDGDTHLRVFL